MRSVPQLPLFSRSLVAQEMEAMHSLFSMNLLRVRAVMFGALFQLALWPRCVVTKFFHGRALHPFANILCQYSGYIEKKVISNRMPKDLDKKNRAQKYRREWEKEHWARGWLSSSKSHPGKAYCYVCNKDPQGGLGS